ncbi:MAG: GAF domain-containing sensor histidine kinase [Actinobacteria bacterium]|nr:GAF domain-containing sensor histidine kinase [Actinomycetota bacterium]
MKRMTAEERAIMRKVNQRIAAKPSLADVIDYLFDETQDLIPCDRISLAFLEEEGRRIVCNHVRANYKPLLLTRGFTEDILGSSLAAVLETGIPRIIGDLTQYLQDHPESRSTELLVREGVRANLTCPLVVEGRVVGFMFRSSLTPNRYTRRHVELQISISERLSQAVDKAWRIEQLEQANRAYLEMLGFVSHELKSPVASMVTDARLVADGYLGEVSDQQHDKLERLIRKGEYLLELVRQYLDLARVEGRELELHIQRNTKLDAEIIQPAVEVVRNQLEERGMTLEIDEAQTPRLLVDCDPALLRVVVVNFLANAAKYGAPGGRVTVKVRASHGGFYISVWNEGPGFSLADRKKLFRRFSRLGTPTDTGTRRGTGLGLYNSWRIVQLHRGRIRAHSQHESWAEFIVEIPQPVDTGELQGDWSPEHLHLGE